MEDLRGYAGKVLTVDLTDKKINIEPLNSKLINMFVGGWGISMKLAFDLIGPKTDPLSPENAVIIGAGPFVGTLLPGTPKTCVATKSPLMGGHMGATAAGEIGSPLKWSGYDHLIVVGKAEKPVYLTIFDNDVQIRDGSSLWGKDVYETSDWLWDEYGDDCTILAIGPAGENLVGFSIALVNKLSTVGRGAGGVGAVLGSKNLKAIVVKGTKGIKIKQIEKFGEKAEELFKKYYADSFREEWMAYGTTISLEEYGRMGNALWKNWRESYPVERHIAQYGKSAFQKVKARAAACPSCPLGCKALYRIEKGEFAGLEVLQSCNVGAAISYGVRLDAGNYNQVIKCHETANRLGICSVESTSMLDYLIDLQEHGVIGSERTDGEELKRDVETARRWLRKIAFREGFGEVLADGWLATFKELGKEAEDFAIVVKGATPDFDARSLFGSEGFGTSVGIKGPHMILSLGPTVLPNRKAEALRRYGKKIGVQEDASYRIFDVSGFHVGRFTKYIETWNGLLEIMGICNRPPLARLYDWPTITELYFLATGISVDLEELLKASERAWNVARMFNVRSGFDRKQDRLPIRWFTEPVIIGEKEYALSDYYKTEKISQEKFEGLLSDYYEERGWKIETGVPTKHKLESLGLAELVEQ